MSLFSEQQTAAAERYAGLGQQAGESLTDYYQRLASTRAGGILGTTGFGSMPTATAEAIAAPEVTPTLSTSSSSSSDTTSSDYPIVNINGDRYKVVQGTDGAYLEAENRWSTGNYNIAGTSADGGMDYIGNTLGYEGNPWVAGGFDLMQASDSPLAPSWLKLIGAVAAPAMIGYDTKVINGVPTGTTRGSFDVGEFTDSTPTDISGGAMGSNVARNAAGDTISIGYGYGQVDPSIARQLGFTVDPTYNPTPEPITTSFDDGSKSTVTVDPATGIKSTAYFDADGNQIGSYTAGQGLTLTQKDENGGYIIPTAVKQGMTDIAATNPNAQSAGLMMLLGGLFGAQSEDTAAQIATQQDTFNNQLATLEQNIGSNFDTKLATSLAAQADLTNEQFAQLQGTVNEQFNTVSTNYKDLLNSQTATQDQLSAAQSSWEAGLAAQNELMNQQGLTYQEKLDAATAQLQTNFANATTDQERKLAELQFDLSKWQATADAERAQMSGLLTENTNAVSDIASRLSTTRSDLLSALTSQASVDADARSKLQFSFESALAKQNDLYNQMGLSYQDKLDVATKNLESQLANATTQQEKDLAQLQYNLSSWQAMADAERAQMSSDIATNATGISNNTGLFDNLSYYNGTDYSNNTGSDFNVADFTSDQAVIDAYNTTSTKTSTVSDILGTPTTSYTPATTTAVPDYAPDVSGMLGGAAADQAAAEAALSQALATGADAEAQQAVTTPTSSGSFNSEGFWEPAPSAPSYNPDSYGSSTVSDAEFEAAIAQDTANRSSSSSDSGGGKIVCTAMNERYGFGSYRNAIWLKYSADHMTKEHEVGYHAMFLPLVDYGFKQGDGITHRIVRKALEHIARHRTTDIRAEMKGRKRDALGRVYRAILEPLCYVVGKIKS